MERRKFNKLLTAVLGLSAASCSPALAPTVMTNKRTIKPNRLRKNDLISLISPGSSISDEGLEQAVTKLEGLGLRVQLGKHIRAEYGHVAGMDKERLADLHAAFKNKEVKAVWCVRGGYGCSRLLPDIDYTMIQRHPKILIGYSDITALLNAIYLKTGLVCFHGPVAATVRTDFNQKHLEAVLMEGRANWVIERPVDFAKIEDPVYQENNIRSGKAEGVLLGGNLSLLSAMAGTSYLPSLRGYLVFIEEIGEKPYRIDRMLTQLRQSNDLLEAAGIAMGIFAGCAPKTTDRSLSLPETLADRLAEVKGPVAYGLPFGHIDDQCTLPVGIRAQLDVKKRRLILLESAVL